LPPWLIDRLLHAPVHPSNLDGQRLCRGTYLSRAQYLPDISALGFVDARRQPHGSMTDREIKIWTRAIGG
jgi:hypothetical protein